MNSIARKNRLNWIDWAKCIAISFVVFGHLPQELYSFPKTYIVTFHMPFFFIISGYLTKKEYFSISTLKKYWHTLIIPYFYYNILFYPYWVTRHAIENPCTDWYDYCKPLIGTIMLQCQSDYFESLNGVTWFIVSLLGYKIILSVCNIYKKGNWIILFLMSATAILYVINEFYLFTSDLPPIGFIKCLPFFFIGYFCRQNNIISEKPQRKDWLVCIICISISIAGYMINDGMANIPKFAFRFWLISLTSSWGILCFCKLLNQIHSSIVYNISIGTIVIMAFHYILIGTTNFILEHILHIDTKIIYAWYIALLLTIIFETMLYPVIIIFKNKYPFMLGKSVPT
jgi:fucose 4-O-acetylase-like acetyltransferase